MEHEYATRLARLGFAQDGPLWACRRADGADVVVGRRPTTGYWRVEIQQPDRWTVILKETHDEGEAVALAGEALTLTPVPLDPQLDPTALTALLALVEQEYESLSRASEDPDSLADVVGDVRALAARLRVAVRPPPPPQFDVDYGTLFPPDTPL